jgi:peptide/histidine transporter 3/4
MKTSKLQQRKCLLYCVSLSTGGHKPLLESFGADQFDEEHIKERKKKMSFFNWWNFAGCFALLLGATVIVFMLKILSVGELLVLFSQFLWLYVS